MIEAGTNRHTAPMTARPGTIPDYPIEVLTLSCRVTNALHRHSINTIGALRDISPQMLITMIGAMSATTAKQQLEEFDEIPAHDLAGIGTDLMAIELLSSSPAVIRRRHDHDYTLQHDLGHTPWIRSSNDANSSQT
jgi:hypothetical protein